MYVNASGRQSARCLDVLSFLPFGIMRSYPGFCRRKQLEYNPGLTHRRRAGHPRANRRTSDRPSFCGVRPSRSRVIMSCHIFQSTHPLRGATRQRHLHGAQVYISIHAPLAGCDWSRVCNVCSTEDFNPRTPCGVRPRRLRRSGGSFRDFNPRTPCGVRPKRAEIRVKLSDISIHAPLAGCDMVVYVSERTAQISIHAPLAGCDYTAGRGTEQCRNFNPRTPCGVRQL